MHSIVILRIQSNVATFYGTTFSKNATIGVLSMSDLFIYSCNLQQVKMRYEKVFDALTHFDKPKKKQRSHIKL